jgi:hypothetical protein
MRNKTLQLVGGVRWMSVLTLALIVLVITSGCASPLEDVNDAQNKPVIDRDQIALREETKRPEGLTPSASATCSTQTITSGQTITGTLSSSDCKTSGNSYQDWYTIAAVAGEQLTVAMNSSAFDAYVYLDKPDGSNLTKDDDSGGNHNALISNYTLPVTGTYKIRATSYYSNKKGKYTVSLTIKSPSIGSPPIEAQISRDACASNDQYFVVKVKRDSTLQFFTEVEIATSGSTKIKRAFLLGDDADPAGDLFIELLLTAAGAVESLANPATVLGIGLSLADYFYKKETNFQDVANMRIRARMSSEVDFFVWLQNNSGSTNGTLTVKWARNQNETISTKVFYLSCLRA